MSGTVPIWSFNERELSEYMQDVKYIILRDLFKKRLISDETFEEYTTRKFLILRKPSFFSRIWKKIFDYDHGDGDYLFLCTAENLDFKPEQEEETKDKKPDLKVIPLAEKKSE